MQTLTFAKPPKAINIKHKAEKFNSQLLKWVGNKQKFAFEIISYFPNEFGTYYEPFLGTGAVLATLKPEKAVGSDIYGPLIEIWQTLHSNPSLLKQWYKDRWEHYFSGNNKTTYEEIKANFNQSPNGADLLFLCRSCYGGVIRFRQADGYMSTPCGVHKPIHPESFSKRVDQWVSKTKNVVFENCDYSEIFKKAKRGDLIYCDPPYSDSQSILYGAHSFHLEQLLDLICEAKSKGIYVALSIDGTKKSGNKLCNLPIPNKLFENEVMVNCGRSMLKRFQMEGKTLDTEVVKDRLLLTYNP